MNASPCLKAQPASVPSIAITVISSPFMPHPCNSIGTWLANDAISTGGMFTVTGGVRVRSPQQGGFLGGTVFEGGQDIKVTPNRKNPADMM
jgi:hypothetical protein